MYIVSGPLITAKQGFLCGSAIKLTRRVIDRLNANVNAKQRLPDGLGTTTTRTAMNLGEPAQHPFGNVLICSPLSKIPVTTAKHRSTIHRHSRQKRRTYLEQRPMTPLEHVSPWSKSFADSERRSDWGISAKKHKSRPQNTGTLGTAHRPRRRKRRERTQRVCHTPYVQPFSQLPSLPTPTQPNTTLPTVVHVETPSRLLANVLPLRTPQRRSMDPHTPQLSRTSCATVLGPPALQFRASCPSKGKSRYNQSLCHNNEAKVSASWPLPRNLSD